MVSSKIRADKKTGVGGDNLPGPPFPIRGKGYNGFKKEVWHVL